MMYYFVGQQEVDQLPNEETVLVEESFEVAIWTS